MKAAIVHILTYSRITIVLTLRLMYNEASTAYAIPICAGKQPQG
jgi:hypothetical protein